MLKRSFTVSNRISTFLRYVRQIQWVKAMGLLSGGLTFGGIFIFEIWWAYYPVGLLSGGLTYGILRYSRFVYFYFSYLPPLHIVKSFFTLWVEIWKAKLSCLQRNCKLYHNIITWYMAVEKENSQESFHLITLWEIMWDNVR